MDCCPPLGPRNLKGGTVVGTLLWALHEGRLATKSLAIVQGTDVFITGMTLCLCALKWLLECILPNNDSNIMGLTLDLIQEAGEELAPNECIWKDCRREKWDCFMITPFVSSVFSWLSCFTYLFIYLCMYHVYVYVHRYAEAYTDTYLYTHVYIYIWHIWRRARL